MKPFDKNRSTLFTLLFAYLFFQSCCFNDYESNYEIPQKKNDGWETASLISIDMDETPLLELLSDLENFEDHDWHSILIVRDGKLVFEEYFEGEMFELAQFTGEIGFDMHNKHTSASATKSITSALVGIAIDKGFIESVDQKISDFYPQYFDIFEESQQKQNLTIKHLLTMRSGITWDDESTSYFDPTNDMYQIWRKNDPIRYILEKDIYSTPGTVFNYDNCNTNLLGDIVRQASGLRLDNFAKEYLFDEIGITDYKWHFLQNNVVFCSGEIRLTPRDMAKFGQLILNNGIWDDKRIISEEWVQESTEKYTDLNWIEDGYAYQWWTWDNINGGTFNAYMAQGWGGQWIIVHPKENMVIVTIGGNYYNNPPLPITDIITDYILESLL